MIYLIDVSDPATRASARRCRPTCRSSATRQHGQRPHRQLHPGLQLPLHDGHERGPDRLRHPRSRQPAQGRTSCRCRANGFTHDVAVDPSGIAWVTGEDGTFGYDTTDPLAPKLRYRSDPSIVNTGGGLPGDDGSRPARLPPPQHAAHVDQPAPPTGRVSRATERRPRQRARDHRGGLRQADLRGPGLAADVAHHRRAQRGRLDQARAARPLDDRAERARERDRPLARDRQLLGALVRGGRRPRSPRAGTTRACGSSTSPTRATSSRSATTSRQGDVLGRLLRAHRSPSARSSTGSTRPPGIDVLHIERPAAGMKPRKQVRRARPSSATAAWAPPSHRWGYACRLPAGLPQRRARAARLAA